MADAVHILASDPALAAVMRQADGVARSNATVLISGESGTGKDLVAGYIHRASGRADGPFVVLNCAELFGGEQGAFPGAMAPHTGKFEAAHGGTLLLDEVGELDLRMQAKLLRAVQHREVDRVAGGPPVAVDCRIIATTNRNLAEEVRLGRFRADLVFPSERDCHAGAAAPGAAGRHPGLGCAVRAPICCAERQGCRAYRGGCDGSAGAA